MNLEFCNSADITVILTAEHDSHSRSWFQSFLYWWTFIMWRHGHDLMNYHDYRVVQSDVTLLEFILQIHSRYNIKILPTINYYVCFMFVIQFLLSKLVAWRIYGGYTSCYSLFYADIPICTVSYTMMLRKNKKQHHHKEVYSQMRQVKLIKKCTS